VDDHLSGTQNGHRVQNRLLYLSRRDFNPMFLNVMVKFDSDELSEPQYIGPFYDAEDAYDYAEEMNYKLSLSGIPSSVACYSICI